MTSHGKIETEKLKENLENQLDRLIQQLNDLESCRDELDSAEYEETKQETMDQLREFNGSLSRLVKGDISLVSTIGAMQLATQAAISEAFKTPEVIRLFGRREPKQLRERMTTIDQDIKLGRCSEDLAKSKKAEILIALRELGEKLSISELQFLDQYTSLSENLKNFEFQIVADDTH